jgi:hypothetical protein
MLFLKRSEHHIEGTDVLSRRNWSELVIVVIIILRQGHHSDFKYLIKWRCQTQLRKPSDLEHNMVYF